MGRLLIVSNRLPVSTRIDASGVRVEASTGGLATGLRGPHEQSGGLWLGWPGDTSTLDAPRRAQLDERLAQLRTVPVHLSREQVEGFYNTFSNGVLWPLFHYMLDRVPNDAGHWDTYREVNERFADAVVAHHRAGDTVWVHDYQLMLVPALLRERLPDVRIGFFLHIPFPAAEVLRILPWRAQLLEGLLGADLVGFHTLSYARHFANSLIHLLGLLPDIDRVRHAGRCVRFGAFPMGVDAAAFAERAPEIDAQVARIRRDFQDQRLLLGIDRLDYTKGIPRRLLAFERLLEREPARRGRVRLLQVAVPSRTDVGEYEAFTARVHEHVGRINGRFSTPTWAPVHHLHRGFSRHELVALYRAADVMLVTPLRDGMNLVAKEFVASRVDGDGVLVLSEFAGAADEMGEALSVNPWDVDGLAAAMQRALDLPEPERRTRMRALRERVVRFDVHRWARRFLEALDDAAAGARAPGPVPLARAEETGVLQRIESAPELLLLLDYDGTLVPFAAQPHLALPDAELRALLRELGGAPGVRAHVISGRQHELLEEWFGALPLGLHAEHGLWSRDPGGQWRLTRPVDDGSSWKPRVLAILEQFVERTPGSSVEEKSFSVAWHYRRCDPEFAETQARELKIHLAHVLSNLPVEILVGDKVVEVRPHAVNKGLVAAELCQAHPQALVVAFGDDRTDEDLFAALPADAVSVRVGDRASGARYSVTHPNGVRAFLRRLLARRASAAGARRNGR